MANFEDSRFLGVSSRTIWLSLAVVGLVVGLFFIPEMIRVKFSSNKQIAGKQQKVASQPKQQAQVQQVQQLPSEPVASDRASLAPAALKEVSSELKEKVVPQETKPPKRSAGQEQPAQDEGFFSGLDFKVKAGNSGNKRTVGIPSGLNIEKLNTKTAQNFYRAGKGELSKYLNKNSSISYGARGALESLLGGFETIANGLPKDVNLVEVAQQLQEMHLTALQALSATGADRGTLLDYLQISSVRFIDESLGSSSAARLLPRFAPRMVLRSVNLRPIRSSTGFRPGAQLVADLGVRGTDVEKVLVYAGSVKVGEYNLGRPDGEGFRPLRVQGDGLQMWTFVAYDRFGGRPFVKSYSFMPRAMRFGRRPDGSYKIAFRPGSARYSLDKFFYAGGTRFGSTSGDPAVSVF